MESEDEEEENKKKEIRDHNLPINQEIKQYINNFGEELNEEDIFKLKLNYTTKKMQGSAQINLQNIIEIKHTFDYVDYDKGGSIDVEEFKNYFSHVFIDLLENDQLERIFNKIDYKCDGEIDWEEFINYMIIAVTASNEKVQHFEYEPQNPKNDIYGDCKWSHNGSIASIKQFKCKTEHHDYKKIKNLDLTFLTGSRSGEIGWWDSQYQLIKKVNINIKNTAVMQIDYIERQNLIVTMNADCSFKFFSLTYEFLISKQDPIPKNMIHIDNCNFINFWLQDHPHSEIVYLKTVTDRGQLITFELKPEWHACIEEMPCHEKEITKNRNEYFSAHKSNIESSNYKEKKRFYYYTKKLFSQHTQKLIDLPTSGPSELIGVLPIKHVGSIALYTETSFVYVFDYGNYALKGTFHTKKKPIRCICYDYKYSLLFCGGDDKLVYSLNPLNAKEVTRLAGHNFAVLSLTVDSEKGYLFSIDEKKYLKLWNTKTFECVKNYVDKNNYCPNNISELIACDVSTSSLLIMSKKINSMRFKKSFDNTGITCENEIVMHVYNPLYNCIIFCDEKGKISIYRVFDGKLINNFILPGKAKPVSITFDLTQRRLYTMDESGYFFEINFVNGGVLNEIKSKCPDPTNLYVFYNAKKDENSVFYVCIIGNHDTMHCLQGTVENDVDEKPARSIKDKYSKISEWTAVAYSQDYNYLLLGSYEGILSVWEYEINSCKAMISSNKVAQISQESRNMITKIVIVENQEFVLVIFTSRVCGIFNLENLKFVSFYTINHGKNDDILGGVFNSDHSRIYFFDSDGWISANTVEITNLEYNSQNSTKNFIIKKINFERIFKVHDKRILSISVINQMNKEFLVSSSIDKNLKILTKDLVIFGTFGVTQWKLDIIDFHELLKTFEEKEFNKAQAKKMNLKEVPKKKENSLLPPVLPPRSVSNNHKRSPEVEAIYEQERLLVKSNVNPYTGFKYLGTYQHILTPAFGKDLVRLHKRINSIFEKNDY